jgi:hypothetical protein
VAYESRIAKLIQECTHVRSVPELVSDNVLRQKAPLSKSTVTYASR